MYRFVKEFVRGGITVRAGVSLKNAVLKDGFICIEGSDVFSQIPLDYVEEYEEKVFEKRRKETGKKTQSTQSEQSIESISRTGKLGLMRLE
jgi:hypothetical protein